MDNEEEDDEVNDNIGDLNIKPSSLEEKEALNNLKLSSNHIDDNLKLLTRSKSMPPTTIKKVNKEYNSSLAKTMASKDVNTDRLKMAKEEAERAIKV